MHTPPRRPLFPLQAGAPRPSVAPGPWDARTPSGARRGTGGRTGPCRGVASEMFSSCQFDKFDKWCCEMHQICEVLTKFNKNVIRCLPMFAKKDPLHIHYLRSPGIQSSAPVSSLRAEDALTVAAPGVVNLGHWRSGFLFVLIKE